MAKWSFEIAVHAILMTLILFIGYPLCFGLLLFKKQLYYHKLFNFLNLTALLVLSLCAHVSFSEGEHFHTTIATTVVIASLIQLISLLFVSNDKADYVWSVYILTFKLTACCLLPTAWYFGIVHSLKPRADSFFRFGEPTGHFTVGIWFYWFGLLSVWNPDTTHGIYTITNVEMVFLPIASVLESFGEFANIWGRDTAPALGFSDHITVDSLLFVCGTLCIIYFLLFRNNYHEIRVRLHTITVGFAGCVMGFILLNHGHEGDTDTRIMVHKICGASIIVGAFFKLLQKWLYAGIVSIFVGGVFMGASGVMNNAWNEHEYPQMVYITIDLFVAFYVAIINLLLYYIDSISSSNEDGDQQFKVGGPTSTNGMVDHETVPFLYHNA